MSEPIENRKLSQKYRDLTLVLLERGLIVTASYKRSALTLVNHVERQIQGAAQGETMPVLKRIKKQLEAK